MEPKIGPKMGQKGAKIAKNGPKMGQKRPKKRAKIRPRKEGPKKGRPSICHNKNTI